MTANSEMLILVNGEQTTVGAMVQANARNPEVLAALREIENGAAFIDLGHHGSVHIAKIVKEPSCDCNTRNEQHADSCELVMDGLI